MTVFPLVLINSASARIGSKFDRSGDDYSLSRRVDNCYFRNKTRHSSLLSVVRSQKQRAFYQARTRSMP